MASKIDYKKEYKDLYQPGRKPAIIEVPPIHFLYLSGIGAPEEAEYQNGLAALYSVSYAIKMSKMTGTAPEGYFEYVMPPLEGLWVDIPTNNAADRKSWRFTSMIRQPDFVTQQVVEQAIQAAKTKKPDVDYSCLEFGAFTEGLCVQMMHVGPYATEADSIAKMQIYIDEQGYVNDFNPAVEGLARRHHEIYLGDPRKTAPEKLKTVLRHPVRPV